MVRHRTKVIRATKEDKLKKVVMKESSPKA